MEEKFTLQDFWEMKFTPICTSFVGLLFCLFGPFYVGGSLLPEGWMSEGFTWWSLPVLVSLCVWCAVGVTTCGALVGAFLDDLM